MQDSRACAQGLQDTRPGTSLQPALPWTGWAECATFQKGAWVCADSALPWNPAGQQCWLQGSLHCGQVSANIPLEMLSVILISLKAKEKGKGSGLESWPAQVSGCEL